MASANTEETCEHPGSPSKRFIRPPHPYANLRIWERFDIYENIPSPEEYAFVDLCEVGSIKEVELILKNPEKRHLVNSLMQRPIGAALERGNIELAKVLIMNGADLEYSLIEDRILIEVVENGHKNVLKFLIEECRIDFDYVTNCPGAILGSCENELIEATVDFDRLEMMLYMIDCGLPVVAVLRFAIIRKKFDFLIRLILSRSLEANEYMEIFNVACERGHLDVARVIRDRSEFYKDEMEEVFRLIENHDSSDSIPVGLALVNGNLGLARLLVEHKAGLKTSLEKHQVIRQVIKNGYFDVLKYLVEEVKIDLARVTEPIENRDFMTIDAIQGDHIELLEYMADHGLPIGSLLYSLVQYGKLEDLTRFLSKLKFEKKDYLDAFNLACEQGLVDYARALLDKASFYKEDISAAYAHAKNRNQTEIVELIKGRKFPRDPKQSAGSCVIQ